MTDKEIELTAEVKTLKEQLRIGSVMPCRLTAENGAKALLIGEFFEYTEVHNEDGTESTIQKTPVSWDTIKEIYITIVDHYGA